MKKNLVNSAFNALMQSVSSSDDPNPLDIKLSGVLVVPALQLRKISNFYPTKARTESY